MADKQVIRQREWTEDELRAAGFRYYRRQKQLVMVRELPAAEAPKEIQAPWATIVAEAGAMICYQPKEFRSRADIDTYHHWPVRPDIFAESYAPWDEPGLTLTPAQTHLIREGCKPFYKVAGAWAKQITEPAYVQSLESPEPVLYPPGAWVLVGSAGEPWAVDDESFRSRYIVEEDAQTGSGQRRGAAVK